MSDGRLNLKTQLPSGKVISTVRLDYSSAELREWDAALAKAGALKVDPALEFESMVFPPKSHKHLHVERYATEEEAVAGHARLIEEWGDK